MFPTLSSLINYLFGTSFDWPIPTFGFFVALAFLLSFMVFREGFKQKEAIGEIKPFYIDQNQNLSNKILLLIGYGILGFLLGFKAWGIWKFPAVFLRDPFYFLFSPTGNGFWGMTGGFLFLLLGFFILKKNKPDTSVKSIFMHPYQLTPKLLLFCAIFGFIGAKLFNIFEDWDLHKNFSLIEILRFSGLTFYGGLIFGAISYLIIGMRYGIPWRSLIDIGSLGMLVAYGVGRLGCHFSGDGDWGVVNNLEKPYSWIPDNLWAFNFPHNVIEEGILISGCIGKFCMVLPEAVFPTSAYETILMLLAFSILFLLRNQIKTPGMLAAIYFVFIGTERLLIEMIRVNYKFQIFGLSLSEAQIISIGFIGLGCFLIFKLMVGSRISNPRQHKLF